MKIERIFNNVPNKHVVFTQFSSTETQKYDYWISRAVTVVGVIFAIKENNMFVLITKRSNKMRDDPNKYCIPCGYLDYNETCFEAMTREVYEETSLYLPEQKNYLVYNNKEQPILMKDSPKNNYQNITLIYLSVYNFNSRPDLFPIDVENYTSREVKSVKWLSIRDFYEQYKNINWAFNHEKTIMSAVEQFNSFANTLIL